MSWNSLRVSRLPLSAKLLVTLFLGIVGPGYLVGTANIMLQHQDADLEPGLSVDDLRATFHGMEKTITPDAKVSVHSEMLEQVGPEGDMRKYLDKGGEPAVKSLIGWLEGGAKEEGFASGDPSPQSVIKSHCVECHHADGGDMEDLPFAANDTADAEYSMVLVAAEPEFETHEQGPQTVTLAPTSVKKLVLVTHAHVLAIPTFTMLVGVLFLFTGFSEKIKLILAPLPMIAVVLDIGSWWLARFVEPFIYVIAASGAIFGAAYALQILAILASMWLGIGDSKSSDGE